MSRTVIPAGYRPAEGLGLYDTQAAINDSQPLCGASVRRAAPDARLPHRCSSIRNQG